MTAPKTPWLAIDRAGLAQIIAGRPPGFILYELIQNALDEQTTRVRVKVEKTGHGLHRIRVEDDSPDGYEDLTHAWTMFAPSKKKGDPTKRGRFNVGCKSVLALAVVAQVVSTKGGVSFSEHEGRRTLRRKTESGTIFEGEFKLSIPKAAEMVEAAFRILPPEGVTIEIEYEGVNREIEPSTPFAVFNKTLRTVKADDDGFLRPSERQTDVELHEARDEVPTLFEMGIPVVELDGGDPYHVNVMQRVPLNVDRDNVTPAYLQRIRALTLNEVADRLTEKQATAVWATAASEDFLADAGATEAILDLRFGKDRVAYDPSDKEANTRAAAKGFAVVHGGSLTPGQWFNAKHYDLLPPAGRIMPTPKVQLAANGEPPVPEEKWDPFMREVAEFATILYTARDGDGSVNDRGPRLKVSWYDSAGLSFQAFFGRDTNQLAFNRAAIDIGSWAADDPRSIVALLIHEFAHAVTSDHLSSTYYDELCRLGAHFAVMVDIERLVEKAKGGSDA